MNVLQKVFKIGILNKKNIDLIERIESKLLCQKINLCNYTKKNFCPIKYFILNFLFNGSIFIPLKTSIYKIFYYISILKGR